MFDGGGVGDRDGVDPLISSGWIEVEPDMELAPFIQGDGVDPQKVEHEYESGDGSGSGVDPSDN